MPKYPTIWVPSWGSHCGLAEYTARLVNFLPTAQVTATLPNMEEVGLLHIQHESALFDNNTLVQQIHQVQQEQVPVIITEHSVWSKCEVWEEMADALVALTPMGVDRLRMCWPNKEVLQINHSCPTWFPTRKSSRGRVIGAFGFLERHKGFFRLLDILREIPGTELLVFSHVKPTAVEVAELWKDAIADLPVRWIRDYLPEAEVARKLASEADILVYWYDEVPHASASGAVRVGLATGVPTLTSPTSWFSDLRNVTYQPDDLISGVSRILEDIALQEQLSTAAYDYCHQHSWHQAAEQHLSLWTKILERRA